MQFSIFHLYRFKHSSRTSIVIVLKHPFPWFPSFLLLIYTLFNSFYDTGIFQYFNNDIEHVNVFTI